MAEDIVKLAAPIKAHGAEVDTLTFRRPTGADFRAAGTLVEISVKGSFIVDGDQMARMISRLAGVPTSSVDQLSAADWQACMTMVLGFLGTSAPTAS